MRRPPPSSTPSCRFGCARAYTSLPDGAGRPFEGRPAASSPSTEAGSQLALHLTKRAKHSTFRRRQVHAVPDSGRWRPAGCGRQLNLRSRAFRPREPAPKTIPEGLKLLERLVNWPGVQRRIAPSLWADPIPAVVAKGLVHNPALAAIHERRPVFIEAIALEVCDPRHRAQGPEGRAEGNPSARDLEGE